MSVPDLGAVGAGIPPAGARQAPQGRRLASAVDANWTQECTQDRNLDQVRRQKDQGPLQKTAMDGEKETVVIH